MLCFSMGMNLSYKLQSYYASEKSYSFHFQKVIWCSHTLVLYLNSLCKYWSFLRITYFKSESWLLLNCLSSRPIQWIFFHWLINFIHIIKFQYFQLIYCPKEYYTFRFKISGSKIFQFPKSKYTTRCHSVSLLKSTKWSSGLEEGLWPY